MPKSKKYSYKRHNKSKRGGGNDTDELLIRLEEGRKYGDVSVPFTYDPSKIKNSFKSIPKQNKESAKEFFEKSSRGMEEQAKLEKKFAEYQERLKNINLIKEASRNPMTAKELFSLAKPEIQKDIDEYTKVEMEPFTYGQGQDKGGRKSRKYRQIKYKTRKSRKFRKSRKQ